MDSISVSGSSPQLPMLEHLLSFISRFNTMDLTFEQDVIAASISIFSTFRTRFPRGFIYDLPISFLDAALIWRPHPHKHFWRRITPADTLPPPSWSWAGWKGELNPDWTSDLFLSSLPRTKDWEVAPLFHSRCIPFLKWHLQAYKGSEPHPIPFQNDWYLYKEKYMHRANHHLPLGWTAYVDIGGVDFVRRYYYKRKDAPTISFSYPIPEGQGLASAPGGFAVVPPSGRYLYLCAKTTKLSLRAVKPYGKSMVQVHLTKEDGCDYQDLHHYRVNIFIDEQGEIRSVSDNTQHRPGLRRGQTYPERYHFDLEDVENSSELKLFRRLDNICRVVLCDAAGEFMGTLNSNLSDDIRKI